MCGKRVNIMNITFQGNNVTLKGKQVSVGEIMPDFTVVSSTMEEINSKDLSGVRIYLSVPSLDTGVCSMEVAKFNDYMKEIPGATSYSISMDLPFALSRWCQNNASDNIKTAADYKERSFAEATGTYVTELGLLARACFVVDANNVVKHVEYVSEMTNEPNYELILNTVKELI